MKIAEVNSSNWERCLQSSNFYLRIVGHEKLWMPIGVPCLQNLKSFFDIVKWFRLYNALHSILCLYEHLWKTVANHTVLFYKWHLHISASTVVAMAVGVLRTDFLESHHTPWLNFFLCRVERSSGNWEKVRTTVLSFWWHSPGQWQIVAMGFWLHWHGFGYHQVWGSRPCQWGW